MSPRTGRPTDNPKRNQTKIRMTDDEVAKLNYCSEKLGLTKTAVINLNHKDPNINKADLAASFQKDVAEILTENVEKAIKETGIKKVALAGGVSANLYIRNKFEELKKKQGLEIFYPELRLCTDNAAMIAAAGYYHYIKGEQSDLSLNAIPNLKLNEN